MIWTTRSIAGMVVGAGMALGLAACGLLEQRTPPEVVKERAQVRWNALVKGDMTAAYSYLSPTSKSLVTFDNYKNQIKTGFWKSAVVDKVECPAPDSCDVVATIEYEFQGRRTKTPLKETWVREGSNWWFVYR
jgi:hypothetical protein